MFAFWSWVAGAVAGCRWRVPLQGAAVRVLCALWSWGAGAAAGVPCRVPLQGAAVRVMFALWSLVAAGCRCKVLLSECRLPHC